ncbi:DUF4097 family beta strand repeat-containing protein [Lederbergia citrea]|uniref:DUF4097 domain-containing protein n=1 Tax=Lederbergia citrea TaxID=2833581 RepID=A0A942Z548_9BACI|nr:DUF4097 domain-containing protein [Lederbergia citrea]MBS4223065.1 DUF4097 domain-containing protein [Lederbergia citrea]
MNQERKRILEMVQNGKLSAQEAIILLEALEDELVEETSAVEKTDLSAKQDAEKEETKEKSKEKSEQQSYEKNEDQNDDSFYSQLESAGEKIFDFVNTALRKIKHIDLQFTQSVDIPHVFQQTDAEFERIDVDIANGPVRITTWDQPEVRIECQAKVYRSEDREDARNYFIDNTVFSIENGLCIFTTQSKWMRVETVVYVPKKQYKKIAVRIFNGGLTGERLNSDHLSVKTTNGKVELANLVGENFNLETVNGQIKLTNSNANQLEAETVNGAVEISGTYQNVELQSFNGNITCTLPETGTNKIEAKAVTGNIHLNLPETATIDGDVRSNLGSYKLDLEGIDVMHEKKEIIQKQVKFKRTGTDERVIYLLADTKTGSVHIRKAISPGE